MEVDTPDHMQFSHKLSNSSMDCSDQLQIVIMLDFENCLLQQAIYVYCTCRSNLLIIVVFPCQTLATFFTVASSGVDTGCHNTTLTSLSVSWLDSVLIC